MSDLSGVRGAASGTSGNPGEGEDDDEEDVYMPPSMRGNQLTVYFPLQVPIPCIVGKCGTKLKTKLGPHPLIAL